MKITRTESLGMLAAALVACASAAQATTLVPGTLTELVRDAGVIVRGQVVEVRPQWADGRRRVETVVVVQAAGYLKGDFGARLAFKVPGGEIGRYQSVMVGAPVFRPGDQVVLFLSSQGPLLPTLVGFSQGVLRLGRDERTGRTLVLSPPLDPAGSAAQVIQRGDPSRRPVPYEQFAARVKALVTPRSVDRPRPEPGDRRTEEIRLRGESRRDKRGR